MVGRKNKKQTNKQTTDNFFHRWNKLGTSVDEEGSSGTDNRKSNHSGTPDSPAGPRIEVTGAGEEIRMSDFPIRDTDTVTIALSKSSNSFDQVSVL